jgi:HAE1 family hydrophobic/amphiphilic exporter-1
MTALAFIFGCLPLWTATGSGAVSRRILGTVVIGGMTLSTLIGLFLIPSSFAVVEYLSHRFGGGGKGTTMDSTHPAKPQEDSEGIPEFAHGRVDSHGQVKQLPASHAQTDGGQA